MTNHTNELDHVLEKKVEACEAFLSATLLLKAALEAEEMSVVDHLIERRHELIGVIDDVDRRVGHCRHAGPPEENQRVLILSADLNRVLKQIMSANRDCEAVASGKREDARKELTINRHREEGLMGYALKTNRAPKFLNVRT
jgi:hypothetical protein